MLLNGSSINGASINSSSKIIRDPIDFRVIIKFNAKALTSTSLGKITKFESTQFNVRGLATALDIHASLRVSPSFKLSSDILAKTKVVYSPKLYLKATTTLSNYRKYKLTDEGKVLKLTSKFNAIPEGIFNLSSEIKYSGIANLNVVKQYPFNSVLNGKTKVETAFYRVSQRNSLLKLKGLINPKVHRESFRASKFNVKGLSQIFTYVDRGANTTMLAQSSTYASVYRYRYIPSKISGIGRANGVVLKTYNSGKCLFKAKGITDAGVHRFKPFGFNHIKASGFSNSHISRWRFGYLSSRAKGNIDISKAYLVISGLRGDQYSHVMFREEPPEIMFREEGI